MNYSNSIKGVLDALSDALQGVLKASVQVDMVKAMTPDIRTESDRVAVIVPASTESVVQGNFTVRERLQLLLTLTAFEELDSVTFIDRVQALLSDVLEGLKGCEISEGSTIILDAEQQAAEVATDAHAWQVQIPFSVVCQY